MNTFIWIGIAFCVSQSAMFSGLDLAFFSISKLRLEIASKNKNKHALKVAKLREDSNFLLTTILWGNVGINVLLTLLSNSVMVGIVAFLFSTFIITFLGEIIPQAYFSRHALKTASMLSPILRFYQFLLFPLSKPTAILLDKWLGAEAIQFFQEKDLRGILKIHMEASETDIQKVEGKGALNFLAIDDLSITEEGETIDPSCEDPFLRKIQRSGKKWVVLTDTDKQLQLTLNSDAFLRSALLERTGFDSMKYCHRPIIIRDSSSRLGEAIVRLKVRPERLDDDVVDEDIILFWGDQKRVITGSDVLGRLLRGIVREEETVFRKLNKEEA